MSKVLSFVLGLLVTACLYFGQGAAHQFAFYIMVFFNVSAWVLILAGQVKGDTARAVRSGAWYQAIGSALQIYAMVVTGHPVLAASSFCASFLIAAYAFNTTREAAQ
tara:strand:- start:413 stop:733 length:321 start_codon:yes stop_codon:yes gene_type:complete